MISQRLRKNSGRWSSQTFKTIQLKTIEVGRKFDDRQLAELLAAEDLYDVRIECKPETGFIRISGLAKNISKALEKINQIIYA